MLVFLIISFNIFSYILILGPPVAPVLSPKETAPYDLAQGPSHQPAETSGLIFLPTQQGQSP